MNGARNAILEGQLIVLPTDTVYGIGADPFDAQAVRRLLAVKGRDETKPPPVLGANKHDLFALVAFSSEKQREQAQRLADRFWPGPLTLVLPALEGLGEDHRALGWDTSLMGNTVAVRVPKQQQALQVLEATGPLAVTSANLAGESPARTVTQAEDYFGDLVAVYVDGGTTGEGSPSTILDLTGPNPVVVRRGDLRSSALTGLLADRELGSS